MIVIEFEHLVAFAIALIVAFFSTPIANKIAVKTGAVTVPKEARHMHKKPMALMGGLAIITGFVLASLYSFSVGDFGKFLKVFSNQQFLGILVGAIIIVILGIVDDIHPLRARLKFPLQLVAAIIAVSAGTEINVLSKPFQKIVSGQPEMMLTLGKSLAFLVSVLWIVGVVNAINLIDGLDGLAAGVSGIACVSLYVVAVIRNQQDIALISIALVGAVIGFLPYNFNPAKIFMGDTGSTFLGYMLAVISISGTMKSVATISLAIPLLVLGLPLFDTTFAILRRVASGRPIGEADRGHIHHRLVDMGLSHKQSVTILYVISGSLGLISIALADKGILPAILLLVLVLIFVIGGARSITDMASKQDDHPVPHIRMVRDRRKLSRRFRPHDESIPKDLQQNTQEDPNGREKP